ncbi:MAG: type II secretion system protein M [Pseudomonadales bacterium]|nr:type II secretion system protein M [Pseudomonadales bacterium]
MSAIDPYLEKYNSLENREKNALLALTMFFVALIIYFAIWSPIYTYHQDSLQKRDTQFSLIQYMRASEKQARSSSSNTKAKPKGQSLITDISNSARQLGIKPSRMQPEGDSTVSVWFNDVVFNDLINWIVRLNEREGVGIQQISIDRQDNPGTVNVRLVLSG